MGSEISSENTMELELSTMGQFAAVVEETWSQSQETVMEEELKTLDYPRSISNKPSRLKLFSEDFFCPLVDDAKPLSQSRSELDEEDQISLIYDSEAYAEAEIKILTVGESGLKLSEEKRKDEMTYVEDEVKKTSNCSDSAFQLKASMDKQKNDGIVSEACGEDEIKAMIFNASELKSTEDKKNERNVPEACGVDEIKVLICNDSGLKSTEDMQKNEGNAPEACEEDEIKAMMFNASRLKSTEDKQQDEGKVGESALSQPVHIDDRDEYMEAGSDKNGERESTKPIEVIAHIKESKVEEVEDPYAMNSLPPSVEKMDIMVADAETNTSQPLLQNANVGTGTSQTLMIETETGMSQPLMVESGVQTSQGLLDLLLSSLPVKSTNDAKAVKPSKALCRTSGQTFDCDSKRPRLGDVSRNCAKHSIYSEAVTFEFDDGAGKDNIQLEFESLENSYHERTGYVKMEREDKENESTDSLPSSSSSLTYAFGGSSQSRGRRLGLSKKSRKPLHQKILILPRSQTNSDDD